MIASLATLLLAASDPDGLITKAADRLTVSDPSPVIAASPYRLGANVNLDPTSKDRAIRNDGGYCNVVGAKMCTSRPRPLLTAEITQ